MTQIVSTTITIKGFKNRQFTQGLKNAANDGANEAASLFRDKLKLLISLPVGRGGANTAGLGKLVGHRLGRSNRGKKIIRSRPGEPPRRETATLWRSIKLFRDRRAIKYTVYTDVEYAAALEFGYAPRNLLPRPHWLVTFYKYWRFMLDKIERRVNNFISRYTP